MSNPDYPVATSALILVDFLNDFLADDGKLHGAVAPMLGKLNLKANLQRLLEGSRKARVKASFSPHGLNKHGFDTIKFLHPCFQMAIKNQIFWKGQQGGNSSNRCSR